MLLADVAVPVPLAQAFTYEVPPALAGGVRPGARVVCDFAHRKVLAVVLDVEEREPPAWAVKPLTSLLDSEPVLPRELLSFLRELSAYYFAPIGEVLRLALPAVERDRVRALAALGEIAAGGSLGGARQVGGRTVVFVQPTDVIEAPGTLRGQAAAVLALLRGSGEQALPRLVERFGNARAAVKKLSALGLVATDEREAKRGEYFTSAEERDAPPELNPAQAEAAAHLGEALESLRAEQPLEPTHVPSDGDAPRGPKAFLLFGITGSGKTEVYLRAIAACLARGRGALMMVPEIALTPQLVARFRARFGDDVAVLHSALKEPDRHAMWKKLRAGEVRVAIGARSALFAPVPELGLVIVDEEHDASFKQEEGVRYHARDMALLRAHRAGAVAVLGSATPSLEAVALVRRGKLRELKLPERAVPEATLPTVSVIDLRRMGAGPTGDRLVSLPLHRALEETLAAGEQAIVFLNRRGFAPSVVCDGCGTVETCRACSVALTFHRGGRTSNTSAGRLRCHYCDYQGPMPAACSSCGKPELVLEGLGTEQLEQTLAAAFPSARIERLDRDVAERVGSQRVLDRMRKGLIDVLVGTQMVTKGHDLPNVTLVGVVNADSALSLPDFRAAERGFQLLVQVAGRAGRRERPGRVLVQTRSPEHPAIRFAARHDVEGFLEYELADRREVGYPPESRLALLRVDAVSETEARAAAAKLAAQARSCPAALAQKVQVLGPAAAPIARLRGRYRFRVLLRAAERGPLRAAIAAADAARRELGRDVRAIIDVDPVSMM